MSELLQIPAEQYHADRQHVSKSWLDRLKQSPAHLRHYLDTAKVETKALRVGRIVHCAILEPDIFARDFVIKPKFDGRTTVGKTGLAEWEAANAGKMDVTVAEFEMAKGIRESVMAHKGARALLERTGAAEQSAFWNNPESGVDCKCRPDYIHDFIVDLKTTEDASPEAFKWSIKKYRYHIQAAQYTEGTQRERFVIIAAEKSPPYGVAVYLLDDGDVATGMEQRRRELDLYAECRATGKWPAYPDTIQPIKMP